MYLVSKILHFILFADDTNTFVSGKNLNELNNIVNNELMKLTDWFKANKLSLNVNKTNYVIFTTKKKQTPDINVDIDGIKVNRVKSTKFLGVILDEYLTWSDHIHTIAGKLSRNIGIIYRVKNIFCTSILRTLYCTLILPYLNYCNIIWGVTYYESICPIVVLQKRIIRIITNSRWRDHTTNLFEMLSLLKFVDLVKLNISVFMYKVFHNNVPSNIKKIFLLRSDFCQYNSRQNLDFYVCFKRSKVREFSISCKGTEIWNNLPSDLRLSKSLHIFKNTLKRQIICHY